MGNNFISVEVKSYRLSEEVFSILETDDTLTVREEIVNLAREKYFEGMHSSEIDEVLTADSYERINECWYARW